MYPDAAIPMAVNPARTAPPSGLRMANHIYAPIKIIDSALMK
jgi:hypothetical protein